MSTQVQTRRDTSSNIAAATGAAGELWVDTDKNTLIVNDGTTAGGHEMGRRPFGTFAELLSTTKTFPLGDVIEGGGARVEIAASAATDHHATTAAGDKLYYIGPEFPTWTAAKQGVTKDPTITGPQAAAIIGRKPMDGAFFGLKDSTSNQAAMLQSAINDAANEGIQTLELPGGNIRSDVPIYACYDATENPTFPEGATTNNSFNIVGAGGWTRQDFINTSRNNGTILEFTNTTGNGLILSNGSASNVRNAGLSNIAVWGNTTGHLVHMDYVPQSSTIRDTFIGNLGDGVGLYLKSLWNCGFDNIDIHGSTGTPVGKGLQFDTTGGTGGGLNQFNQVTTSYFATGQEYGSASSGAVAQRANTGFNLQGRHCTGDGINIRAGFQMTIKGLWYEDNDVAALRVSDNAQHVTIEGVYNGGSFGGSEGTIVVGRSTDSGSDNAVSGLMITNAERLLCEGNSAGLRVHGGSSHVPIVISMTSFSDNDGAEDGTAAIWIDNDAPGIITLGEGIDWGNLDADERIVSSIGGAVRWDFATGPGTQGVRAIPTDISARSILPSAYYSETASGDRTTTIPASRTAFEGWGRDLTVAKTQTNNSAILDAGTGNTIGASSQTYTMGVGADQSVTLRPTDTGTAIKWLIVGTV